MPDVHQDKNQNTVYIIYYKQNDTTCKKQNQISYLLLQGTTKQLKATISRQTKCKRQKKWKTKRWKILVYYYLYNSSLDF